MTSILDIYRSAQILVKHHSEDAPIEAAMRADAMLKAGDLDAPGWAAVMAAEGPAAAGQSGAESQRTELWR